MNQVNNEKRPLKRSKTGLETEYMLLDSAGMISNRVTELRNKIKAVDPSIDVHPEIGQSMIEFGCYPDVNPENPALDMIKSIQVAHEICEKHGLHMYPFATYPGHFEPLRVQKPKYELKEKIFGKPKVDITCQVVGFHHHYTLPKGVFDAQNKEVRLLRKSKLERTMVSSYNLEIAIDPILTLFAQSSPFFQGNHFAKDTRVVVYRGGKKLRYMDGAYSKLQQLGALPPYKQTATDLLDSLRKRWKRWETEVKKADPNVDFDEMYPHKLDIGWHPVKLNKHGTLEQRGMDENYISTVIAITVLLKYALKKIQRDFVEVIPADFGISEAFKIENEIMYIPPHSMIRNRFQPWSAYVGYENDQMHEYAKRFYNFAKSVTPKAYQKIIQPIGDMIEHKQSMSDQILKFAKRKGYMDDKDISQENAAEMALFYAKTFPKDLEKTKDLLEKVGNV